MLDMAFFMGLANGVMTRAMNGLFGVIGMELAGDGEWNWDGGVGFGVALFVLRSFIFCDKQVFTLLMKVMYLND